MYYYLVACFSKTLSETGKTKEQLESAKKTMFEPKIIKFKNTIFLAWTGSIKTIYNHLPWDIYVFFGPVVTLMSGIY